MQPNSTRPCAPANHLCQAKRRKLSLAHICKRMASGEVIRSNWSKGRPASLDGRKGCFGWQGRLSGIWEPRALSHRNPPKLYHSNPQVPLSSNALTFTQRSIPGSMSRGPWRTGVGMVGAVGRLVVKEEGRLAARWTVCAEGAAG